MPVLTIKHITSFSSEDPIHSTTNILSLSSNKTWRCKEPGEKSAFVVLQLDKASVITGIDIGNDHTAFVEVSVGRTGNSENKFEVLLAMSSLMTPMESRNSETCNRVRMFTTENFSSQTRLQKWDQIKVVCTQPFNVHVPYGLAFIKIHGLLESTGNVAPLNNSRQMIGRFKLREESPEDDVLSAGSLFARRNMLLQPKESKDLKPAAAIRKASIDNSPKSTSICLSRRNSPLPGTVKDQKKRDRSVSDNDRDKRKQNRNHDELFYDVEDLQPNERLDKLLQRDRNKKKPQNEEHTKSKEIKTDSLKAKVVSNIMKKHAEVQNANIAGLDSPSQRELDIKQQNKKLTDLQKAVEKNLSKKETKKPTYQPFNKLLKNVVFVLSGFQNPLRANLRQMALEMGAFYQTDWNAKCTHLICAFPNTPKYQQVLGHGKIIKRNWIEDCHRQRKKIPWRRYSLVSSDISKNDSEEEILDITLASTSNGSGSTATIGQKSSNEQNSCSDSEEEIRNIQKAIAECKKMHQNDELDVFEMSTEIEDDPEKTKDNFFVGKTFHIDKNIGESSKLKIERYVHMYGGTIDKTLTSDIDYNITVNINSNLNGVKSVKPEWVYECNDMEMLVPINSYLL